MYLDDSNVWRNTRTVEVYQPWSDTWFKLPTLPNYPYNGAQYPVTDAKIFSLLTAVGYKLYLVGCVYYDLTRNALQPVDYVYHLVYNGTYNWIQDSSLDPDMGK